MFESSAGPDWDQRFFICMRRIHCLETWEKKCLQEYRLVAQQLVKEALKKKEAQFAAAHSHDTLEALSAYLQQCAKKLGYTPHPIEVIGSNMIIQKFSSWAAALKIANLKALCPEKEPPPFTSTKLYRDEWLEQWAIFQKARKKEQNRQATALARVRTKNKSVDNKLKKELSSPQRRAQERVFAALHTDDTDRQIFDYLKGEKRRLGSKLKPINTIGYSYITKRLGPWHKVISKVNAELKAEQQENSG